ncbi:carboxymuconolactone decarboxylase family protein [Nocardioides sp. BGMRC 2183]|nr:carboxymuconolactone decarboxylase family protein [Nocardioides sp. BGMRC 2183]
MSLPGTSRVEPGGWREVGPAIGLFSRIAGRVQGTEPPRVFLTLGRHRRLFWGWLHFAGRLMPGGRLARREAELVILRVAARLRSEYELVQHRRLGARAGLTAAEVAAAEDADTEPPGSLSARELAALRAADEIVAGQDLSDLLWAELGRLMDEQERIELVMLIGHYAMLATVLRTLRVAPDSPTG